MKKPEQKAFDYLKSRRWIFDNEKEATKELKLAFEKCGYDSKAVAGILYFLLNRSKDWAIYSLNDIRNLDKARRIYQANKKQ